MARRKTSVKLACCVCGASYWAHRSDSRTCGPTCKKALQRAIKREHGQATDWTARDVTAAMAWLPANRRSDLHACSTKGDNLQVQGRPVIQQVWPQGTLVRYLDKTSWRPGRINWLSKAGEECTRYARHCTRTTDINNTWQVPVETLCGVTAIFAWDVRRE